MNFTERTINQFVFLILFTIKHIYEFYLNGVDIMYAFTGTVLIGPVLFVFCLFILTEAVEWIKEQNKQPQIYES